MTTRSSLFRDHGAILLAGCVLLLVGIVLQPTAGALQDDPIPPGPVTLPAGATHQNSAIGTTMAGNGMIVATAIDMTGSNVLYVIDTNTRQLAVYQANGGSDSTQSIRLVGARKIDLDLQLVSYNDKSKPEVQYRALEKQFDDVPTGTSGSGKKKP